MSGTHQMLATGYREPWQLNVLLVDDSVEDRDWIARQLAGSEEFSVNVTLASSFAEAARLIGERMFHLAIVDYRLHDGMGDKLIATIARNRPCCATILMSSHAMSEVSLFGLRAGANAALSKDDINPELLETTIRFALFNQQHRQERAATL